MISLGNCPRKNEWIKMINEKGKQQKGSKGHSSKNY